MGRLAEAPFDVERAGGRQAADAPLVCHILFRLDVGGLENGVVNLINHMPYESCRHSIISLKPSTGFRSRIERPDVAIHEVNKREGKDLAAYARVFRILRAMRPDVVHTRNLPALDMLVPAALARVPRLIHSEHGLELVERGGSNAKYNFLRRMSRLVVDHYVCVSPELAQWMQGTIGVPPARISTIFNGVDTERFAPGPRDRELLPAGFAPPEAFVIGTVGRFEPVKDQLTLARAFVLLLAMRPELARTARLVLVGDGRLRADLEQILAEGDVSHLAWLPGVRADTPALYRQMDVFALPSASEGLSNTLLEAMASGLPVVATRVGGSPRVVAEGETALLVPPRDPVALATALLTYADDRGYAREHGRAGRARAVREFSLASMVRQYAELYRAR